jgi:hypothetical protein
MRIGIIAEGRSDFAVLANILSGRLGVRRHQLTLDETDLSADRGRQQPDEFSNYSLVLSDCSAPHDKLRSFLDAQIAEDRFVVVHIDTDKCHTPEFGVARPPKKPRSAADAYTSALRELVADRLETLLGPELRGSVCLAIAVEETEAWLWDREETRDTGLRADPKKYFRERVVEASRRTSPRAKGRDEKEFEYFDYLSQGFRDGSLLAACAERNGSLGAFVASLGRRAMR